MTFNDWQRNFVNHYNPRYRGLSDADMAKKIFKSKILTDDIIETQCLHWSYGDSFIQGGRYVGFTLGRRDEIETELRRLLKKYKYVFSRKLIDDMENFVSKYPMTKTYTCKNGRIMNRQCTSYGLAQKFVNMYFKNMLAYTGFLTTIKLDCSSGDCPLDSNIIKSIGKQRDCTWSRIDKAGYKDCQDIIKKILSENPIVSGGPFLSSIGNQAYDYIYFLGLLSGGGSKTEPGNSSKI